MSTRSVCAVPFGDTWRGRYVHSDGYPTAKVPEYLTLVARDGLGAVTKKLTEDRYGWSSIEPSMPDIAGVLAPKEYPGFGIKQTEDGAKAYYAHLLGPDGMYGDGRFACEPGYGIAYTTHENQSAPDHWITPGGDRGNWGTEWAYILSPGGLFVLQSVSAEWNPKAFAMAVEQGSTKPGDKEGWLLKGTVPWGSLHDGREFENYPDYPEEDS